MVKPFYYIIGCVVLHFIFGWLASVMLTILVGGMVFERLVPLKTALTGATIHTVLLVWTYLNYPGEVSNMTYLVDQFLLDFVSYSVPTITVLIPAICYGIAGFVADHGLKVYYRISVSDPREESRKWNQSF